MHPANLNSAKPPAKRRWRRVVLEAGAVALVFFGISAWNSRGTTSGPAPAVEGTSLTGQPLSLAALRGEPVAVHFWATWCGVCSAEQGNIDKVAKDHRMITIAESSGTAAQVSAFMAKEGLSFPVMVDDGTLARAYGVSAFPTTFIVGRSGTIRFVEVGYATELGLRGRLWLAGL